MNLIHHIMEDPQDPEMMNVSDLFVTLPPSVTMLSHDYFRDDAHGERHMVFWSALAIADKY